MGGAKLESVPEGTLKLSSFVSQLKEYLETKISFQGSSANSKDHKSSKYLQALKTARKRFSPPGIN